MLTSNMLNNEKARSLKNFVYGLSVGVAALFSPAGSAAGFDANPFARSPNVVKESGQSKTSILPFGPDVKGLLVRSETLSRCDCLLIWNGAQWNEDLFFLTQGREVLKANGFYRPYNHSPKAYQVHVEQKDWLSVKKQVQYVKAFPTRQAGSLEVLQLDSPHAPFVYVQMNEANGFKIYRLPSPEDEALSINAWLKQARMEEDQSKLTLFLTYELYQVGTGQDSSNYTVQYQFNDRVWQASGNN